MLQWGHEQGGPPENPDLEVGGTSTFDYTRDLEGDPDAPTDAVLKTTDTDRNGNITVYYFNVERLVVKIIERTNRAVRPGEGDYVGSYTYTSEGLLTSRTFPRGNGVSYIYDSENPRRRSQGNLLEIRKTADGVGGGGVDLVKRYTYEPVFNQLRTMTDPRGFPSGVVPLDANGHLNLADETVDRYTLTHFYDYQEDAGFQNLMAVPPGEQIPEDLGDLNGAVDFDEGNVVKVAHPTIQTPGPNLGDDIVTVRASNEFGQPAMLTDPEGHITKLEYFETNGIPNDPTDLEGYVRFVTRDFGEEPHFNLASEYGYDTVGNVVFAVDPKGQRADFSVNQLNQVVRIESRPPLLPDAPETRYQVDIFYNENDDVVKTETLSLDELGAAYTHGLITSTFEHNILHYPVAVDLDKTLNDSTGAGSVRTEYFYDANLNSIAVKSPESVNGNHPDNIVTVLYDERDLPYKTTNGDDDTDPSNNPPETAVVSTVNYDPNRNALEGIDALRDAKNPAAPTTQFPGSAPGDVSLFTYDGFDRLIRLTDGEANLSEILYDLASNATQQTLTGPKDHTGFDPALLTQTDIAFDELNRAVTVDTRHFETVSSDDIGDGHSVSEFEYDLDSKLVRVTDDLSLETVIAYDTADRQLKVIDHLGNELELEFDANSNVTQTTRRETSTDLGTAPDIFITQFTYDGLDRLLKTIDPADDVNEFFYDSRSNVVKTSDALRGAGHPLGPGNIISYDYDALDRLVTTIRRLTDSGRGDGAEIGTITTTRTFDDNSRVTDRTDDNGHTTSYDYDNLNRLTELTYDDGTSRTTQYDTDNRVSQWTDQNLTECDMSYDGLSRLLSRDVTPGAGVIGSTSEVFGYDGASRITFTENNDGFPEGTMTCDFTYDSMHNRTQDNQMGLAVDSVHDGVGNRIECTYPGQFGGGRRVLDSTFDDLNRLQSISDSARTIATMHYKGPARLERRTYGVDANPISKLDLVYDAFPRVIEMNHTTGGGGLIAGFHYGYDRMHHRLFEKRTHEANTGDVYAYDSIYRAINNLQHVDLAKIPSGMEILPELFDSRDSLAYVYDGVGNRLTTTTTQAGVPVLTTYEQTGGAAPFDAEVNQYTTVQENGDPIQNHTYDDNGNLTSDGTRTYAYDFKNRLVEVRDQGTTALISQYSYDAFDRRSMKILPGGTTHYIYDGHECVEERDESDNITRQYVWGNGIDQLIQEQTQTDTYYAHENSIGDIAALTDDTGTVVERYSYDPFGNTTVAVDGGTGNEYRYHGARFDPETGFYFMRARYYIPSLGRFAQRDPIGVWTDWVNLGNGYTLVGNNAINGIDPKGTDSEYDAMLDYVVKQLAKNKEVLTSGVQDAASKSIKMRDVLGHKVRLCGYKLYFKEDVPQLKKKWFGVPNWLKRPGKKVPFLGLVVIGLCYNQDVKAKGTEGATKNAVMDALPLFSWMKGAAELVRGEDLIPDLPSKPQGQVTVSEVKQKAKKNAALLLAAAKAEHPELVAAALAKLKAKQEQRCQASPKKDLGRTWYEGGLPHYQAVPGGPM